jgi:hypothetical protein
MQSIFDTLVGFILTLLGLIVAAVTFVELAVRSALGSMGIQGPIQTILLLLLFVALIGLALRIFGRLLAVLLTAAFLVYLLHALLGIPHHIPMQRVSQDKTVSF